MDAPLHRGNWRVSHPVSRLVSLDGGTEGGRGEGEGSEAELRVLVAACKLQHNRRSRHRSLRFHESNSSPNKSYCAVSMGATNTLRGESEPANTSLVG